MRRRDSHNEDSLELLLDTICNVFGGIIFIAMLVALLTSARSHEAAESHPRQAGELVPAVELVEAQFRVDQYRAALDELIQTLSVLGEGGLDQSLANLDAIAAAQQSADARREAMERWLAAFEVSQRQRDDDLTSKLAAAQSQLKELERKLEAVEAEQKVELRLPMARQTNKIQVILLLKGGKAYVVPAGRTQQRMQGFSGDVTISPLPGGIAVQPQPNGGTAADATLEQSDWFRKLMSIVNPQQFQLDCFVYSDTVAGFSAFRAVAMRRGFEYGLTPMTGEPPTFGFASQSRETQ